MTITTTGAKVISGQPFEPKAVSFFHLPATNSSTSKTGIGYMDASTQFAASTFATEGGDISRNSATDACLVSNGTNGAANVKASRTSLNSDGFTINVTTMDLSSEVFGWIMHR